MNVLLVGNPNCGKTTLFNALTGEHQRIGNWPGVTVEKKIGSCELQKQVFHIIDLPGTYSLVTTLETSAKDEQITAQALAFEQVDIIINVVDACHLERHLYLTTQLLELGYPVIVALNMMDLAKRRGVTIDTSSLSQQLGCPVVPMEAANQKGLAALKRWLIHKELKAPPRPSIPLPNSLEKLLHQVERELDSMVKNKSLVSYYARRLLEGDHFLFAHQRLTSLLLINDSDILVADARYQYIHQLVAIAQTDAAQVRESLTAKIDKIVLHRLAALPIFLLIMYTLFLLTINLGGAFQDFFDTTTETIFVQGTARVLQWLHMPAWVMAILAYGLGTGIHTTLTFIPVIATLFFFLSLLELSGYMARAAFVVDKLMRFLGLPGKAFVPMIVGFGCNVPAIMAARTLDSDRDRKLTILMSPFMSCSARLAIYAVFVSAFFPVGGQNIIFSLYLFGILMAVFTGFLLRKTIFQGPTSPLILELPTYHKPQLKRVGKETYLRLRHFLTRAAFLILPICTLLGTLKALTIHGYLTTGPEHQSILAAIGRGLTPLFYPMGIQADNWPATVGLLTGMLAKEVVIGTLNTLYTSLGGGLVGASTDANLWSTLHAASMTLLSSLSRLGYVLIHPLQTMPLVINDVSSTAYGVMYQRFDGPLGAYAYLLFILLYIPCVSTMGVIRQEAGKRLMWFSVAWSLFVAYVVAVLFYQLATHAYLLLPLGGFVIIMVMMMFLIHSWRKRQGISYVITNS